MLFGKNAGFTDLHLHVSKLLCLDMDALHHVVAHQLLHRTLGQMSKSAMPKLRRLIGLAQ